MFGCKTIRPVIPVGTTPDDVQFATAVVPDTSAGNLTVSLANGATNVPAGQPFNLNVAWNLTGTAMHWYGRFGLGTDSANPDNLGLVDLDLHVKAKAPTALFFPVTGKDGKVSIIYLE